MLFHDVITSKQTRYGKCGVKDFWDSLSKVEYITLPFDAGLGIMRKQ